MSLYDSHNFPPLPSQPEPPLSERIAQAMALRGQVSEAELHTILNCIYGSARDFGEYSLDAPLPQVQHGLSKIPFIQATVAKHFDLTVGDMVSKRRSQRIIRPRQIAMYLCKQLTPHSFTYIGKRFGRDHTTVIHAVRKVGERIAVDAELAAEIETLKGMMG